MAEADYTVADRVIEGLTAGQKADAAAAENITPDADAAQFAADAGVSRPEYANYATALDAYAARADIEGLAERRAREGASAPGEQDFMRQAAYKTDGTAAAAPRPGTIYGDAPDAAGDFDAADDAAELPAEGDDDGVTPAGP